jgi:translation initiation factor 2 subunit 1
MEVDMSIRRVSDNQRRAKLAFYKQEARSGGIAKAVGEKFKLNEEEIKTQINQPLKEKFTNISSALIESREGGAQLLIDAGVPEDIAKELQMMAVKELEPPSVTLVGILDLTVYEPSGIDVVKEAFEKVLALNKSPPEKKTDKDEEKPETGIMELCSISAPKYRVVINAPEWKEAEDTWKSITDTIEETIRPYRSQFSFSRE